jgi:hypothetical protein
MANPNVAKATEGAAPNNPAKLVGLNKPPTAANAETTAPPITNRTIASMSSLSFNFGNY